MATRDPTNDVFRIPELCGIILSFLSDQDIFRLQNLTPASRLHFQGYRSWLAALLHSSAISQPAVKPIHMPTNDDPKRVIWIVPTGDENVDNQNATEQGEQDEQRTRDERRLRYYQHHLGTGEPSRQWSRREDQCKAVKLNWVLQERLPKLLYYPLSNMLGFEEELFLADGRYTRPDASCRPLLLTVPPLSEVDILDKDGKWSKATNSQGVTFGDIVDAMLSS